MEHSTINLRQDLPVLQMRVALFYRRTMLRQYLVEQLVMLDQLPGSRAMPLLIRDQPLRSLISKIRQIRGFREKLLHTGLGERHPVMHPPGHRFTDVDSSSGQGGDDLDIDAVPFLLPRAMRPDRWLVFANPNVSAVHYQGFAPGQGFGEVRSLQCQRHADQRHEFAVDPRDGGLADIVLVGDERLAYVVAQQVQDDP